MERKRQFRSVGLSSAQVFTKRRQDTLGMFLQVSCQCSWTSVMLWFVTLFYLTITNIQPLHRRVVQSASWRICELSSYRQHHGTDNEGSY